MKALGLLSGGLDSILAIKLIQEQGIEVVAVNFTSSFWSSDKNINWIKEIAQKLKVLLINVELKEDYLKIIRKPKYGYGKNMNPCIDCKILMLKKAKKIAEEVGASFIFTGEVLDERPKSQHKKTLEIIEKESGLKGKLLRPLSAKLLPETEAEKKRWVDREILLDIRGRRRERQIQLAKEFSVEKYPSPGGGCLLTYKEFSKKLKDLLEHERTVKMKDIELLRIGRHFRFDNNKIIVGRNEEDNEKLLKQRGKDDYFFEVPVYGSPITLLQGPKTKEAIKKAAGLTARYSDVKRGKVSVEFGREKLNKSIIVKPISEENIKRMRIF
jgi:tRNA U34 2-thiouridine synthase MnmA/TrmU